MIKNNYKKIKLFSLIIIIISIGGCDSGANMEGGDENEDTGPPSAPSITSIDQADSFVRISWSSSEDDIDGYDLYKSESDGSRNLVNGNKLISKKYYRDSSLTIGKKYKYWVSAVDTAGRESDLSQPESVAYKVTKLTSPNSGGQFGGSLSSLADVNGDGVSDIVVGAPGEGKDDEAAEAAAAGRVYIVSGSDYSVIAEVSSPNPDGGPGLDDAAGAFGRSHDELGDVNQDDVADFVVGAPGEDSVRNSAPDLENMGRVYIISGNNGSALRSFGSPSGEPRGDEFGKRVSGLGDINQNGTPDFVATAPEAPSGGLDSRIYFFDGSNGTVIDSVEIREEPESLVSPGDIDGDNVPDLAIGDTGGNPGRVVFVSGMDRSIIRTASPSSSGSFGADLSQIADLDGDGAQDLAVGAPLENGQATSTGKVYVISSSSGGVLQTAVSPNPTESGGFGSTVSSTGDVSGDGSPDLVVGAPFEGNNSSGNAYVINGGDGSVVYEFKSTDAISDGRFGEEVLGLKEENGDPFKAIVDALEEDGGNGQLHIYSF